MKEVEVVHILKQIRVVKALMKLKMTKAEWKKAYDRHSHLG